MILTATTCAFDHLDSAAAAEEIILRSGGQVSGVQHVPLDGAVAPTRVAAMEILAIEEALKEFHRSRPRAAQVVEWRFFGGFKVEETSLALGVSPRTVESDWEFARAWLHRALGHSENAAG